MTQRELGIAVGYSESHINRFEKDHHLPDPAVVAALFIPELSLVQEPEYATRLIELAGRARAVEEPVSGAALLAGGTTPKKGVTGALREPIPPLRAASIPRTRLYERICGLLERDCRVSLCGLPGMGKTSLGSRIAREYAERMPVYWLTLTPGIAITREALLHGLASFLYENGQEQLRPLVALDPRARQSLSPERQLALLTQALAARPVLLCFDNAELLQHVEGSLQLLQRLSTATPAYLLLMMRECLGLEHVTELSVSGFEPQEGLAFLSGSVGAPLSDELAGLLVKKTGGSPMLLRLAAAELSGAPADAGDFAARLEAAPQVAAYLLQTVRQAMPPAAWNLLLLLATFQRPVDLYDSYLAELAQSVADIPNLGEAVQVLQRRRLIENARQAGLPPLIREYATQALALDGLTRARMHRLAADWFRDGDRDVFAAAWHYCRAGLVDQSIEMIEEHTSELIGIGLASSTAEVLDELETQLKRRRASKDELARRALVLRGQLLAGTLRAAESEASFRQAIAMSASPVVRASIICQLAEITNQRSEYAESLRLVQAAQAGLNMDDLLLRARLAVIEASARSALGELSAAEQAARLALSLADQLAGMPLSLVGEIRMRAQLELSGLARNRRDLPAAMESAQICLAISRSIHHQRGTNLSLAYVGGLHYDLGNLDESFRYRSEGLEGLLAIGDVHSAAYVLTYLADIHFIRLEAGEALQKLLQAEETLRTVEDLRGLAAAASLRTACLLWQEQLSAARAVIEGALQETRSKQTERLWGYRLNKLAMVQLAQGEAALALATLRAALALPAAQAHKMMLFELNSTLALAQTAAGDLPSAVAALAGSPRLEGLSRWAEFDRQLAEGYLCHAQGDSAAARARAESLAQQAAAYPLYREGARRLALAEGVEPSRYPFRIYVG
jgi:hypothetical protein